MSNQENDFWAELGKKMKTAYDKWLARIDEELEDPVKGPILREKLIKFIHHGVKPATANGAIARQSTTATDVRRQRLQRWMHTRRRIEVTITLPKYLLQSINGLAEAVEKTRSEVIKAFAEYCLDHEDIIDELFPRKKEDENLEAQE
ncbi:MAG: hypothetical protein ACE5L6_03805 [Candidatus Bathyarchaeia archaeon]